MQSRTPKSPSIRGDFNIMPELVERIGKSDSNFEPFLDFNSFVPNASLLDIDYSGRKFSWCNNRQGPNRQWAQHYRCLFSQAWVDLFSSSGIDHLAKPTLTMSLFFSLSRLPIYIL